jgi:spermidine synthase
LKKIHSKKKTDTWFIDKDTDDRWIYHRVKKHVISAQTTFQTVDILDTYEYGRMVILDGKIQSSESDEFIYHEILVHPVMLTHPKPENILILGAGEGATLREVLRHPTVKKALMIDTDKEFVEICKRYLKQWHQESFRDRRVELIYDEAFTYLKKIENRFDVIITDINDPGEQGPSVKIYTAQFYSLIKKVLMPDGIFVTHATAVYSVPHENFSHGIIQKLSRVFPKVNVYYEYIPSFGALWSYATGSFQLSPKALSSRVIEKRLRQRGIGNLSYYAPEMHERLFIMPHCMRKLIPVHSYNV